MQLAAFDRTETTVTTWIRLFETGEASIGGEVAGGTAMYEATDGSTILFRADARNIGISPTHNPPTPDPGAYEIERDDFRPASTDQVHLEPNQ